MMTKNKKLLSLIGCFAFVFAAGAIFASPDLVSATEITPTVAMLEGASVRIVNTESEDAAGKNGLRFTTYMNAENYQTLMADEAYTDVSFGVLIAPNTEAYTLTETSVFGTGTDKKYDWATWNETEQKWEYTASSYTRIMNFETSVLYKPNANEAAENMYFRASIVDIDVSNIATEFQGVGYIKYTKNGTTTVDFAEKEVRSMAFVAQKAIADTSATALTQTEKSWLQTNYVDAVSDVEADYTVEHYVETANGFILYKTENLKGAIDSTVGATAIRGAALNETTNTDEVLSGKVWADGSLVLKKYYTDSDAVSKVGYIWGGSATTAPMSLNTDAVGLNGTFSKQSVKIEDQDISGYNDFQMNLSGYNAFAFDVKIVLDSASTFTSDCAVPVLDEISNYIGSATIGEWQTIYSEYGNWGVRFEFPEAVSGIGGASGKATIYLDNIRFYTAADLAGGLAKDVKHFASVSNITQLANGDTSYATSNGVGTVSIPNISPSGESTHHNHALVVTAAVSDISDFNGITFIVKMKTWTGNNRHYFYLIPQASVATLTADVLDGYGQIHTTYESKGLTRVSESYLANKANNYAGWQRIHITKAELTAAGYDVTNLTTVAFAFRNSVWNTDSSLGTTGWSAIGEAKFADFKVY